MNKKVNGRTLSFWLRHKPESVGLSLDSQGWCSTQKLLKAANISFDRLKEIVNSDEKTRFSFTEDFSKIRANQGHSINVNIQFQKEIPPPLLYHGTSKIFLDSILKQGLLKGNRHHVHLSKDLETALQVASRRKDPIILHINSKRMVIDNIDFFKS